MVLEVGLLSVLPHVFGPTLYDRPSDFAKRWQEVKRTAPSSSILNSHWRHGSSRAWLIEGLKAVNAAYDELQVSASDFESSGYDEWEPLPLNRTDPKLQEAIRQVDATIEQVRGDNGYTATKAEERSFVLDKLGSLSKALKTEAKVSWMYLNEFGFKPLGILIQRFKGAVTEALATAAKGALLDWLKGFGAKAIEFIAKNII